MAYLPNPGSIFLLHYLKKTLYIYILFFLLLFFFSVIETQNNLSFTFSRVPCEFSAAVKCHDGHMSRDLHHYYSNQCRDTEYW